MSTSEPTCHAHKAHRCHQRPQAQRALDTCCHATSAGKPYAQAHTEDVLCSRCYALTHALCLSVAADLMLNAGPGFKDSWEIKMLYDGDCPLCMREVNMLRKRDKGQNKIGFVDISSQGYSPGDNAGISYEKVLPVRQCLNIK
jgi:hypothetical protein